MRISDWSSDVCSSDLRRIGGRGLGNGYRPASFPLGKNRKACVEIRLAVCQALNFSAGCTQNGARGHQHNRRQRQLQVLPYRLDNGGKYRLRRIVAVRALQLLHQNDLLARPFGLIADNRKRRAIITAQGLMGVLRSAFDIMRIKIGARSEEHTSELQSLMRISYSVFCLKKKHI